MKQDRTEREIGTREEVSVNARNKLNVAYVNGAVLIAGIVGLLTQLAMVFGVVLIGLLIAHYFTGGIRPKR